MKNWEYMQATQVRDPKTGHYHWADQANWRMIATARLAKAIEYGCELAAAYPLDNGDKIIYLLKRPVGWEPAG